MARKRKNITTPNPHLEQKRKDLLEWALQNRAGSTPPTQPTTAITVESNKDAIENTISPVTITAISTEISAGPLKKSNTRQSLASLVDTTTLDDPIPPPPSSPPSPEAASIDSGAQTVVNERIMNTTERRENGIFIGYLYTDADTVVQPYLIKEAFKSESGKSVTSESIAHALLSYDNPLFHHSHTSNREKPFQEVLCWLWNNREYLKLESETGVKL